MSPTVIVEQKKKDVVSPTLNSGDTISSMGHYSVQYTWIMDSTTLQPVTVNHSIELGSNAVGVI